MADTTTRDINTPQYGTVPEVDSVPVAAVVVRAGQVGAVNPSGFLIGSGILAGDVPVGLVEKTVDNSAGAAGALNANVQRDYLLDNDATNAITQAMLFRSYCYLVDNHTAGSSDVGGTLAPLGVPVWLGTGKQAGKVAVRVMACTPHAPLPGAAQGFEVRGVATNIEAGSFAAGVFTATANGALAAQDGLTIAVGDLLMLPAGTLTTLAVTAANSGPYVVTAIGSASAKVVLTRPSWWRHADGARLSAQIRVRAGTLFAGTTWRSFSAAAVVIGTGDPALYPEQVTQQVTLVAGTRTISNVPIFSTSRLGMSAMLAGGTPAGTTTNYQRKLTSGATAGGIGTAALVVEAQSVAGTIVNTDVAVLNVTIFNG
jgi:hypothetical protein